MVSVSVRTAGLPQVQRKPSAMSRPTWLRAGRPDERRQHHARDRAPPRAHADGLDDERPGHAGGEEHGADGRADQLVHREPGGHQPGVADAEVGACPPPSAAGCGWSVSTKTSAVPSRNIVDEDDGDVHRAGDQRRVEHDEHRRPASGRPRPRAAGGRSGRPARRRTARTAATAGAGAARPAPPAAGRRSARRPAAARRPAPIPSPRLPTHDEPTSQRNGVPMRAGRTASTTRLTSRAL